MDSRFLRNTLIVSFLFMVLIFGVVLYANGLGPGQKKNNTAETTAEPEDVVLEGQIGDDLYGWMSDDSFFDEDKTTVNTEDGIPVSLVATSVEKDLRVQIVDHEGNTVEGQFFKIKVGDDEYKDLDRDGVIYVGELEAGDYQVSLMEQEGFIVPAEAIPVRVKSRVEYVAIGDISLLIKTEEEVDAMAEDGERTGEETEDNGPTDLQIGTDAYFGIDVSRWNEEIDWEKVKDAGVQFAIIRVGYRGSVTGTLVEDWYFAKNIQGAIDAGIPVGVYFFTQATTEVEAVEEASMVISLCRDYKLSYPVFIDTEGAGGSGRADNLDAKTRTAVCQAFCETMRSSGYQAGIYASKNWYKNNLDTSIFTDDTVIWLAEYNESPTYTGNYHLWQYTSSGRIVGIEGRVDLNLSYLEPQETTTGSKKKAAQEDEDEEEQPGDQKSSPGTNR